ncbi:MULTISPECIES: RNA polymerase sigma factor [Flavobacterium]|uniref:Sigma-70 family RNA polymerase sigma factor n=1 Tax=Flavobacterium hankyongi TaxID=1176532 RepID=A0ABP9A426_9FLAO|nr:sigma-70 family RNA polymerase sigma factor [Flavobacterium sp. N1846]
MEEANIYIDALLTGNSSIIDQIYKKNFPKISSYIKSNKGNADEAMDIFQEALMYILITQKEKRTEILNFEAYLFVVCRNIWKKKLTNRVINTDVVTLVNKESDLAELIVEQKYFDLYTAKFNLLSENCKEILAVYFNGASYEEIANENDYATVNTVRQRVFKCRSKLIELIKEDKEFQLLRKWELM